MPRPVFVELLGFPGSGKTTVAKAALTHLRSSGATPPFFYGRDGKHHSGRDDVTALLAQVSRTVGRSLGVGGPRVGMRQWRRFLPVVDKTLLFRRVRRRHGNDAVVLFDQGPIQMLYLLGDGDVPGRDDMVALLELLRPDLAEVSVFMDTPAEVAAHRYFARAKSTSRRPYKGWNEERISALYAAHVPAIRWIAEWLEASSSTMVLRLDGRLEPERNGVILARAIEEATHWAISRRDPAGAG
ncbi:MAG: hypothetical protein U5S82_08425 [Gammaproteobacteria bacterium]|nr:hypothetical protein [Gammaproteobacteria bacterium]